MSQVSEPALASAAGPMVPVPYRITEKRQETHDTWTFELEPAGGESALAFGPGQFTMLSAGRRRRGADLDQRRPDRDRRPARAHGPLRRARDRGDLRSRTGAGALRPRSLGVPWPVEAATGADVIVLAGGIGLAPLRSGIYSALGTPRALWPAARALRRAQPGRAALRPGADRLARGARARPRGDRRRRDPRVARAGRRRARSSSSARASMPQARSRSSAGRRR